MSHPRQEAADLGRFLRAARSRVDPAQVGLPTVGLRRVSGLRREEVAVLAGVSANYYTRLEQGRERHPSVQVLDALSRALNLGPDAHDHLHRLAGAAPGRHVPAQATVRPDLLELVEEWTTTPAMVISDTLDVLAQNRLTAAMHSGFAAPENLALMLFTDPFGSTFYVDWRHAARSVVAGLRLAHGHRAHNPRLRELVTRLWETSEPFREFWNTYDVRGRTFAAKRFQHPDVGLLELSYQAFDVRGSEGQQLIVYKAERGSRSAGSLRLLASLAAPSPSTGPLDEKRS